MNRSEAREIVFKLVFEYAFNNEKRDDLLEEYTADADADSKAYITEVYFGVISHYTELGEAVSKTAEKFAFDRLYSVDKALLFLALYEIKFMESIPYKVSVDEALKLAEKYSTNKSVKYINGVLSKFAR